MSRVIALDLDDTLLRSDYSISPRTLEMLAAWEASGNRLVVATGRPPRSIPDSLPDELMEVPWICYNGAEIRQHGAVIYQDLIPAKCTREVVALIDSHIPDICAGLEINNTPLR
ncbi:MAG: HAD family phosphatase [Caldilineaceae bacterium]|nr:HAD family phosphatase [Caldilineaceae bacterium]